MDIDICHVCGKPREVYALVMNTEPICEECFLHGDYAECERCGRLTDDYVRDVNEFVVCADCASNHNITEGE